MADPNCMKCLGTGWYPISLKEPWLRKCCSCVIDTEIEAVRKLGQERKRKEKESHGA